MSGVIREHRWTYGEDPNTQHGDSYCVYCLASEWDPADTEYVERPCLGDSRLREAVTHLRKWALRDCAHTFPVEDCEPCANRDEAVAFLVTLGYDDRSPCV